jgi:two-component system sensor histidine kinase VicK
MELEADQFADRLRFKQIVNNLLINAIKFMPVGGMAVVTAGPHNGFAEISVSETGVGIPGNQQHAVFEKFYQRKRLPKAAPKEPGWVWLSPTDL